MSKTGTNIAIAGAVAVGAYMLLSSGNGFAAPFRRALGMPTQPLKTLPVPYDKVTEVINPAMPGQVGYAWRYFNDGTSIGPDGSYYYNGALVWQPS